MSKINCEGPVVTVLNYEDGTVSVFHYTSKDLEEYDNDIEQWLIGYHDINTSNCDYMCTDELQLIIR